MKKENILGRTKSFYHQGSYVIPLIISSINLMQIYLKLALYLQFVHLSLTE